MKMNEFVQQLRTENEKLIGNMPEKRTARLVRAIVSQIGAQIDQTDEGIVQIPGLGRFIVKQVTPEGKSTAEKRVLFRRLQPAKAPSRRIER